MSYQSNYIRGSWNCICESCGRLVKAGELRQRWDGFMVDEQCWEPRQPQDFVRGVADYQAPPFTRPEQGDVFVKFSYSELIQGWTQSVVTLLTRVIPMPKIILAITSVSTAIIDAAKKPFFASNNRQLDGAPLNNKPLG